MAIRIKRWVYNVLLGRRVPHEPERLDFEKTKELLEELKGKTCLRGRIDYYCSNAKKRIFEQSTTPSQSYDFVSKLFKPSQVAANHFHPYFEGTHKMYSDGFLEMHYFEISSGVVHKSTHTEVTPKRIVKTPRNKASLEFLVKKS
jgi:hypothetical protein